MVINIAFYNRIAIIPPSNVILIGISIHSGICAKTLDAEISPFMTCLAGIIIARRSFYTNSALYVWKKARARQLK
jgi:hypothetical protein